MIALRLLPLLAIVACTTADSPDGGTADGGEDAASDAGPLAISAFGVAVCPFEALCGPVGLRRFVQSCMRGYTDDAWLIQRSDAERARVLGVVPCVRAATTCDEYFACMGSVEPCAMDYCDGDTLVDCWRGRGVARRIDCAAEGLTCVDGAVDSPRCTLAGSACGDEELSCDGDISLWCPGEGQQVPSGFDCASIGMACDGFCVDASRTPCTESTCSADGTEVSYCFDDLTSTYPCDLVDADHECFIRADGEARCGIPADHACVDGIRCEGTDAIVCARGKEYVLDCAQAGGVCSDTEPNAFGCVEAG